MLVVKSLKDKTENIYIYIQNKMAVIFQVSDTKSVRKRRKFK